MKFKSTPFMHKVFDGDEYPIFRYNEIAAQGYGQLFRKRGLPGEIWNPYEDEKQAEEVFQKMNKELGGQLRVTESKNGWYGYLGKDRLIKDYRSRPGAKCSLVARVLEGD